MIRETQQSIATLSPGRGVRTFSIPGDPAGYVGNTGIHFNMQLDATSLLMALPLAGANATGASYLSNIHGGLGSDTRSPAGIPAVGQNSNVPSFPNPEVTGYYLPPAPQAGNALLDGYSNTEKAKRSASDAQSGANNGTIWESTQGRFNLNMALWIARAGAVVPGLLYTIALYRDLNPQDKVAGFFGAGGGPTDLLNAQLVAAWTVTPALTDQNMPNLVTAAPFPIPAGCNLYLLFTASDATGGNKCVGDIWLS